MLKSVLSILFVFSLSSYSFAGKIKDLIIDADEAIVSELARQGESVDQISGHRFVNFADGVAVEADAAYYELNWKCTVYFKKQNDSYSVQNTVCK